MRCLPATSAHIPKHPRLDWKITPDFANEAYFLRKAGPLLGVVKCAGSDRCSHIPHKSNDALDRSGKTPYGTQDSRQPVIIKAQMYGFWFEGFVYAESMMTPSVEQLAQGIRHRAHSNTISLLKVPRCSTVTSTTSPCFNHCGGFMPKAAPEGVPDIMTVPFDSVVP